MRQWLAKFTPNPWLSRKLLLAAVLIAVGAGAFCWGRRYAHATPPGSNANPALASSADPQGTRVVAYINSQPIYREELGEYLIARYGADRVEFLVSRKIVEAECKKYNIVVTDADVNYRYLQELRSFGGAAGALSEADFVSKILRPFNKTLYEWKEDVIRPKLMMEQLVRATIRITDADIREGFEARFGPKVQCRMLVLKDDHRVVDEVWAKVRNNPAEFIVECKKQFIPELAKKEGVMPPIHKHFGDKNIEEKAFQLKENEISTVIGMPDGTSVILMCEKHLPENKLARLENERERISKEMEELRIAQRIPEVFKELRKSADVKILLKNENASAGMQQVTSPAGRPAVQTPESTAWKPSVSH